MKLQILIVVLAGLILSLHAHRREEDEQNLDSIKRFNKKDSIKNLVVQNDIDNVCAPKFCSDSLLRSKQVKDFCNSKKYTIDRRCCLNNDTITGLDYTRCSFTKLTKTMKSLEFKGNFSDVVIFDVRENNLTECKYEAYERFTSLNVLYFPAECNCPGGDFSWKIINIGHCSETLPYCKSNATYTNCTINSKCIENGPGNFLCSCKENFHGYKCLEEGTFPKLLFTLLMCGLTLFLCAFLWYNQRRLIIKKED